jgi:hypothetical protein
VYLSRMILVPGMEDNKSEKCVLEGDILLHKEL